MGATSSDAMRYTEARLTETDDIVARLDAAYKLVSFWPERDMAPGAIEDLGMGFMHLLALRNLVPEAMSALTDRDAQIERLTREIDSKAQGQPSVLPPKELA